MALDNKVLRRYTRHISGSKPSPKTKTGEDPIPQVAKGFPQSKEHIIHKIQIVTKPYSIKGELQA